MKTGINNAFSVDSHPTTPLFTSVLVNSQNNEQNWISRYWGHWWKSSIFSSFWLWNLTWIDQKLPTFQKNMSFPTFAKKKHHIQIEYQFVQFQGRIDFVTSSTTFWKDPSHRRSLWSHLCLAVVSCCVWNCYNPLKPTARLFTKITLEKRASRWYYVLFFGMALVWRSF